MKIYLKFNAASEQYVQMVTNALQKAGHEVLSRNQFSSENEAMHACHVSMDLTAGKLVETAKPSNPKRVRKDVDERVAKLVLILGKKVLPRRQLVADLGLKQKSRRVFIYNYMKPTWEQGLIDFSYTAVPHKPEQAYRLTAKGLELYAELTGESAYV